MADVNPTEKVEEDEEFVRETTVGRTFAYSTSVLIQILLMVICTLLLISDNHHGKKAWWDISNLIGEEEQMALPSLGPWEATNHAAGKLLPCLLLPLLIIIPPNFMLNSCRNANTISQTLLSSENTYRVSF